MHKISIFSYLGTSPQLLFQERYNPEIGWMQDLYEGNLPLRDFCNNPYIGARVKIFDRTNGRFHNVPPMVARRLVQLGKARYI